jgi:predicted nuclease of predicted toxin-antitoxin system
MRILFDQCTPVPLRRALAGHSVDTAFERGWSQLQNGELLAVSEQEGYDLLVSTDQNLKYQQTLSGRQLAIIVLLSASWPRIQQRLNAVRVWATR